jgi:putative heme-binding domain-containing protein
MNRYRARVCFLFAPLVAVGAVTLLAQDSPPHATTEPVDPPLVLPTGADDIDRGRALYSTHCASCHGPSGEGGKGPTLAQPMLARAQDDAALYKIIREGVSGTEMPRARLEKPDVARVAAFVKSLGTLPMEQVPGDPLRGAQLYATKGACAKCHTLGGEGSSFGPDLNDIGRRRSAAHLRRSLLEPNAEVPQSFNAFRSDVMLPNNFLYVRAVTRDGRNVDGVRVNEDTFSIQIREAPGRVHSLFKADLKALHKDWGKSPMPSYADAMTSDEIDDLVAFMATLREVREAPKQP